jgi:actin-related protein
MISSISKELHQQYANAPKTPYKLPDGTVLHVSQTLRFDVAECLFGNHPTQCRKRQDAMMILQQGLDEWKTTCKSVKGSGSSSSSISTSHSKPGVFSSSSFYKALSPYLSPSSMGELSSLPISNMVCDSVFKCDVDQQPQLLGNVVLCGGGSCFTTSALLHSSSVTVDAQQNSMPERLREEVEAIIHNHTPGWRVKVSSPGITERAICSWLGGSILGSLGAFHEMWITKKEYEEHGSNIVHRKCP